ncbi:MAG: FtsQ-type POTRA domain-containing protein [Oscillospiraceae bacterium]|nr:FtsQ-type POTRA domain-containing protein [Oscillospiraceae bacterium]
MASSIRVDRKPRSGRNETRAPRRRSSFSGPLMFVVVIVAVIFVMSVFFRVSDIQVKGNLHYTAEEVIRASAIEEGDNLFFFDRIAAISRALSKLPYIEDIAVERSLPNKVVITVEESAALAYLELGDEQWTLDHRCKVLGKAAEGETDALIAVVGIKPGTLMIGEQMETEDHNTVMVEYLAEILDQIEARGLTASIRSINFADPQSPEFEYQGKYTVVLGRDEQIEHKFGMFVAVLDKLKAGDIGIIDISDGATAHFSPN